MFGIAKIRMLSTHVLRVYQKVGEVIQANNEVHPIKTLTCSAH